MANRAYLFCSDCDADDPSTWIELDSNKQRYYDSRHDIPLSWFFFFRPDDVKLVDVFHAQGYLKDATYWQVPKFMADKQKALETFKQSEALLAQIVGQGLYSEAFANFLPSLEHMAGECLCVDPGEVLEGGEEDYLPLRRVVELIGSEGPTLSALREAADRFSETTYGDKDDIILKVIGYTYWSYR